MKGRYTRKRRSDSRNQENRMKKTSHGAAELSTYSRSNKEKVLEYYYAG